MVMGQAQKIVLLRPPTESARLTALPDNFCYYPPPTESARLTALPENFCYYPSTESARLTALPENFCYYPPPPLNLLGLRRCRKISATTPPHRIWSASGDHGKLAPPTKNPGYAVVFKGNFRKNCFIAHARFWVRLHLN